MADALYRPTAFGYPVERPREPDYFEDLQDGASNSPAREVNTESAIREFERFSDKGRKIRERASHLHALLADFRKRAARNWRFYTSDQWSDTMQLDDGRTVTERQYIEETNRLPVSFNQIDPMLKNLIGQLRQNASDRQAFAKDRADAEAAEQMTLKLRDVQDVNHCDEVDVDQFREMLATGIVIYKQTARYNNRFERFVPKVERIDPNRFFFNSRLQDPYTFDDLEMVGDVRDYRLEEVIDQFGGSDPARRRAIFDHYNSMAGGYGVDFFSEEWGTPDVWPEDSEEFNFDHCPTGRARVYEVWQREWRTIYFAHDFEYRSVYQTVLTPKSLEAENRRRMSMGMLPVRLTKMASRMVWMCYYITPGNWILREMMCPYFHEDHPFTIGFAEYINGTWYGLIDRLLDIQKFMNRIYSAIDFMMGTGAKGVLMVEESHVGDKTPEEFAEEWREFGGVIVYKAKPGVEMPKQITANSVSAEWFSMLQLVKGEIQDMSGVTDALQGRPPTSGTPAERYQAEITQSSVNNLNFFHRFFSIVRERDRKLLQITLQSATEPQQLSVPGQQRSVRFDPARVRDIEWDVAMADVTQTAAHRQLNEEFLFNLVLGQLISFDEWLMVSSHPAADKIKVAREMSQKLGIQGPQVGIGQMGQVAGAAEQSQRLPSPTVDQAVGQLAALAA